MANMLSLRTATSPVRELLATLAWLGPHARGVLPELESAARAKRAVQEAAPRYRPSRAGDRSAEQSLAGTLMLRRDAGRREKHVVSAARIPAAAPRRSSQSFSRIIRAIPITFKEFFHGQPSIVVFFYTRCDNPMKCSLTVTKLGRIQKLLEAHVNSRIEIHTAAITYDPAFDLPERLRDLWTRPRRPYGRPPSNAKGDR